MDNSPHGQLAPWTTRLTDNSQHGQLDPWTTRPMTTRPITNDKKLIVYYFFIEFSIVYDSFCARWRWKMVAPFFVIV